MIIYDNEITSSPNIIMSNDGHGHLIDIPSVFISNADGEKILNAFKCSNSMILKIHFDVFASKIADVTFWLDVNNRESFITLRDFYRDYHKAISNYVNYDVKYILFYLGSRSTRTVGEINVTIRTVFGVKNSAWSQVPLLMGPSRGKVKTLSMSM